MFPDKKQHSEHTQKKCPIPKNLAAPLLYPQIFLISILLPKIAQLWHDPLPQDMPGNKNPAEIQYMQFSLILILSEQREPQKLMKYYNTEWKEKIT